MVFIALLLLVAVICAVGLLLKQQARER